jgi:hypothetical protein
VDLEGFGPGDPGADGVGVAFTDPGGLGFDALAGQCLAVLQDEALLPGDAAGDVSGDGDAVGVAEDLDPSASVGRLGVAQPAQAFGVGAERGGVFQCAGDVEERRGGPGVVEVDEADGVLAVPDAVSRGRSRRGR